MTPPVTQGFRHDFVVLRDGDALEDVILRVFDRWRRTTGQFVAGSGVFDCLTPDLSEDT